MINPTDVTIDVTIGGENRRLYFNLNAFQKFEEVSGKKFPRFLFGLVDAWSKMAKNAKSKAKAQAEAQTDPVDAGESVLEALGEIGAKDILALVYGACHEYDAMDDPRWPLSPGRLGRLLSATELVRLLPQIMTALQRNVPKASDAPKTGGEETGRPTLVEKSTPTSGGSTSGGEVDPLALLTVRSGDSA